MLWFTGASQKEMLKRGQIQGTTDRGNAKVVDCFVPLSEMFGYATSLRSMSQGRAAYTMEFDHYEEVPKHVAATVIAARGKSVPEAEKPNDQD